MSVASLFTRTICAVGNLIKTNLKMVIIILNKFEMIIHYNIYAPPQRRRRKSQKEAKAAVQVLESWMVCPWLKCLENNWKDLHLE
jgi:hypothetical protein